MTEAGAFNTEKDHKDFYSRTDARLDVINRASWGYLPYPGKIQYINMHLPLGFQAQYQYQMLFSRSLPAS